MSLNIQQEKKLFAESERFEIVFCIYYLFGGRKSSQKIVIRKCRLYVENIDQCLEKRFKGEITSHKKTLK